jgi:glycosyl transferase family 25
MLPIYVISLKASTSRRRAMTARMAALGLDFSFIDGVIGKDVPAAQRAALLSDRRRHHLGAPLSDGALGCLMSHRRAWEVIRDTKADAAIILEDDADLAPEVLDVLPRIATLKGRFDLINLHHTSGRPLVDAARISPTHALSITRYVSIGAIGYVVSRTAAERLLDVSVPGIFEVDVLMNRWWEHGLKTLVLTPPIVQEDGHDSTIGYPGVKPKWDHDRIGDRIARDINRKRDSLAKRLAFSAMVRAAKRRLAGGAPRKVSIDLQNPDLTWLTETN